MMFEKIKNYFSLVKFGHTIFAMPFAFAGFFMATHLHGFGFDYIKFVYIILCMIFARNAAMGFNRLIDKDIDSGNIRTANREIPKGIISKKSALIFVITNALLFIATTYFINRLCFFLSPVALLVILGYSLTKRFTFLCHFILGIGLSLAPIGAYIAVSGQFDLLAILLSFVVLFWTAGFDIIYSLQDESFDKMNKLFSIPSVFGKKLALAFSAISHFIVIIFVVIIGLQLKDIIFWIGAFVFSVLLIYEHLLVTPQNMSKINIAFATINSFAGLIFGTFTVLSFLV